MDFGQDSTPLALGNFNLGSVFNMYVYKYCELCIKKNIFRFFFESF